MLECLIDSEAFTAVKKKYFAAYMFFVYEDRLSASLQCFHAFIPYIFSTDAIYGLFLPNRLPPVCHVVSSSSCQLSCELGGHTKKCHCVHGHPFGGGMLCRLDAHLFTTEQMPFMASFCQVDRRQFVMLSSRQAVNYLASSSGGVMQKRAILFMAILSLTYVPLAVRNVHPYTQNKLYI